MNPLTLLPYILGTVFWLFGATWVLYLAVMKLKEAHEREALPPVARGIGYCVLAVGLVNDFLLNIAVCLFVFFEIPRDWLLTTTLERHLRDGTGYKWATSRWLCENLLDPFQTGGHCGR